MTRFPSINKGYNTVFQPNRLSLGLVVPIENYSSSAVHAMENHIERIQLAEALGFAAVWLRDVPFDVPSFGDAGQIHDPFVYLGLLAGQTKRIALGVASIILPLRHPAHVAKAAASVDALSDGRLILGVASGDRPEEYPAMNLPFENRGALFRESFDYIRRMGERMPSFENSYGSPGEGLDLLPKPVASRLPLMITGSSQQDPDWIARNGDGWMIYPRSVSLQKRMIEDWRNRLQDVSRPNLPVMQPLYIDLTNDPDERPHPIHLGLRLGVNQLKMYLKNAQSIGVNHLAFNLRFNRSDIETTMKKLAQEVLPEFNV